MLNINIKTERKQLVGRGRSAIVYLDHDADGSPLAQKVFNGEGVSKAVLYVLTGSANPYTWCESAMRTAVCRRHILSKLVQFWFGNKLRLPRGAAWGWNKQHLAYELKSELVDGHHAPLENPVHQNEVNYLSDLILNVMKPLQRYLAQAGFDGLVWQAGRGNPVACNNFMLENHHADQLRWVWIDLESGVPALFALNPVATFGFYLPKSIHHRRWLFDDVDTNKLRNYLDHHRAEIESVLGMHDFEDVLKNVNVLEQNQDKWRSLPRHHRGIQYDQSRMRLTEEQARWYFTRPLRWYARQLATGLVSGIGKLTDLIKRLWSVLLQLKWKRILARSWRYITSTRYRWGVARWYIARKIDAWRHRGMLDDPQTTCLRHQLRHDDASTYLTDFTIHLAIKAPVKTLTWGVFPLLWAAGIVSGSVVAFVLVAGGAIGRTLYTTWRLIQAMHHGQRRPWVALAVGLSPVIGNLAYPIQLLFTSQERNGELARFIVYDITTAMGRAIPIWGGSDTQTEHFFNRVGAKVVWSLVGFIRRHPVIEPK